MAGIPGIAGPGAPYPQYAVVVAGGNPTTGVVEPVGNSLDKALLETDAFPSHVYFFVSRAAALAFVNSHGGSPNIPGVYNPATGSGALGVGAGALNTSTGAIQTSGDILKGITSWLGQGNIWLRGAEMIVGILVIYIGLKAAVAPEGANIARRTTKQTFSTAVKLAKKVPKLWVTRMKHGSDRS